MSRVVAAIAGFVVVFYMVKRMNKPKLRYFKESEFFGLYPLINSDLLIKLDEFRHRWGAPVMISPAAGSIVRYDGSGDEGQHNFDKWGETRAIDVFPQGMQFASDRERAYKIAKEVGFTGIGLYTDTVPSNLLHVDVRKGSHVATWARVDQKYVGIDQVLA